MILLDIRRDIKELIFVIVKAQRQLKENKFAYVKEADTIRNEIFERITDV